MLGAPGDRDFDGWIRLFADPLRAQGAFWHLVHSGADALPSVQQGLDSRHDDVRRWSTKVMILLVRMLDDPTPRVRAGFPDEVRLDRCGPQVPWWRLGRVRRQAT
jgi:hypothetical protein